MTARRSPVSALHHSRGVGLRLRTDGTGWSGGMLQAIFFHSFNRRLQFRSRPMTRHVKSFGPSSTGCSSTMAPHQGTPNKPIGPPCARFSTIAIFMGDQLKMQSVIEPCYFRQPTECRKIRRVEHLNEELVKPA